MTLSVIGLLALALICARTFGGIALRLGGAVIGLAGLFGLSLAGNANGLLVFAFGASLWLAGHLHSACATAPSRAPSPNGFALPPPRPPDGR